jgi:hypothetical protein
LPRGCSEASREFPIDRARWIAFAAGVGVRVTGVIASAERPATGRYQVAAVGTQSSHGAYVTDTATGETFFIDGSHKPPEMRPGCKSENLISK